MTLLGKNESFRLFGFKTARVTVYLPVPYKPEKSNPGTYTMCQLWIKIIQS